MHRGPTGERVLISRAGGERAEAFVPLPLPPDPPLRLDGDVREKLDQALLALGRLDSVTTFLPDTALFLYAYVRKEAVLSSQIEGTQSSLSDLLLFELEEAPGVPIDDVREVSCYVAALEHGLRRIREGFPLSSRLIREMHGVLLARGRGAEKSPGEFRQTQNWIAGTRPGNAAYVPPPPKDVPGCMGALEKFLHDEPSRTPVLVKAALAHAQFETIHPFLDGNGRIGRLLITLILCHERILREPLLYLSLFFKSQREQYYELLQRTRIDGDWETWIGFFSEGVRETADGAVLTARRLETLFKEDREAVQSNLRASGSALQIHDVLQMRPVNGIPQLAQATSLSVPTVTKALKSLERLGIVREITGKRRNRLYSYHRYLGILSEGTEE